MSSTDKRLLFLEEIELSLKSIFSLKLYNLIMLEIEPASTKSLSETF